MTLNEEDLDAALDRSLGRIGHGSRRTLIRDVLSWSGVLGLITLFVMLVRERDTMRAEARTVAQEEARDAAKLEATRCDAGIALLRQAIDDFRIETNRRLDRLERKTGVSPP